MVPVNNNSSVSSAIRVLGELSPGDILMYGTSQQQLNRKLSSKCAMELCPGDILMHGTSQQQLNRKFC